MPSIKQIISMTSSIEESCSSRCGDHCEDEDGDEDECCNNGFNHVGKRALKASEFFNDPEVEVI